MCYVSFVSYFCFCCYYCWCCCCCFFFLFFFSFIAWFVEFSLIIYFIVVKNILLEEFLDSNSFIEFGKCLIIFGGLFENTFMKLRLLFGFFYGRNASLIKLKVTSRKWTSVRFVLISVLKPKFVNTWTWTKYL